MSYTNLKLIALITMVIDHIGISYDIELFRIIGRCSFPIYAFLIVNGFNYSKNIKRYLSRLLLFAVISEIPFQLFKYNHINLTLSNVFVTLSLGLIAITMLKSYKNKIIKYSVVFLICICAELLGSDYGFRGVLLVVIFYLFRNRRLMQFIFMSLLWIGSYRLNGIFGLISLVFIWIYNPRKYIKRKISKYFFYWFYPVHLLVLYLFSL